MKCDYYVNLIKRQATGDVGAADRRCIQKTINPLGIAADCGNIFEQLINITGNHRIFNPADNMLAFLYFKT